MGNKSASMASNQGADMLEEQSLKRSIGVNGVVLVGAGSVLHPARKIGARIDVLCKCAATRDRIGRPPLRFVKGLKCTCASGRRSD